MTKKPSLTLTGPSQGPPTLDDLVALYRRLTGKEPSADEVATLKRDMAKDGK